MYQAALMCTAATTGQQRNPDKTTLKGLSADRQTYFNLLAVPQTGL